MASITFKLTGFRELSEALVDLGPKVANKIATRGMREGCDVIAAAARARCPRSQKDQPHLKDSIVVVVKRPTGGSTREAMIGFLHPASKHAGFVEYGRAAQAAEPFMRPAIEEVGTDAIELMGEAIGEDIEAAAAGYPLGRAP